MYHRVFLACIAVITTQSSIDEVPFKGIALLGGYNITSWMLYVGSKSVTRLSCAIQCSQSDSCSSYFYNSITRQCQFHTVVFLGTNGAATQTGTEYYYRLGNRHFRCPTDIGFQILGSDELCVKFHTDTKSWSDANTKCANYSPNGHLVVVDTETKNKLVRNEGLATNDRFETKVYIGLTMSRGWVDGSPLAYQDPVMVVEPGGECASYSRPAGWTWYIIDSNRARNYICQISF